MLIRSRAIAKITKMAILAIMAIRVMANGNIDMAMGIQLKSMDQLA